MRRSPETSTEEKVVELGAEFWTVGFLSWLLGLASLIQLFLLSYQTGVLQISPRWQVTLALGAAIVTVAGVFLLLARRAPVRRGIEAWRGRIDAITHRRALGLALIALAALAFPLLVFGIAGRFLDGLFPRLLIFWLVVLAVSTLLRGWFPATPWKYLVLAAGIGYGLLVRALAFVPELSAYPFSLGWSEASRYYYASLFDSQAVYGLRLKPSELHPTRYLLQSLPFFVAELPLWFHRLWQVLLWWLLPMATAALIVVRHRLAGRWFRLLAGAWIVLYLFQGPVYYHLLVMVIIVLAGLDARRPLRSTLVVVAASIWAGLSRLNWYPVPGLLAGSLYLIETPADGRSRWRALRWPIAWVLLGTLVAFASQAAYGRLTGIEINRFTSSLSSQLLFYRLLPSPTYSLGILPAVLMASAPLLLALWLSRAAWLGRLDPWRRAFLTAALLLLAGGGVVVSLKIGGGSNLHNLDAYLVLLLLIGSSLLLQTAEGVPDIPFHARLPAFRQTALIVAVPVIFAVAAGTRWIARDVSAAQAPLSLVRAMAQEADSRGQRVLFISQRHLLTFGLIPDVALEPEYETVFLMEMAMSGNRIYLDRFHELLRQHAFGLIVVDRLTTAFQGRSHNFGEENDAWVREVSLPLLCWYEFSARLEQPPVDLLVPRTEAVECPG